jgi:hypothetical protein
MAVCATCGGTEDVRLYERRDAPGEQRAWWCVDCCYFAVRLSGIALDPVPRWIERAALNELPPKPVDDPLDRPVAFGRRATDRVFG